MRNKCVIYMIVMDMGVVGNRKLYVYFIIEFYGWKVGGVFRREVIF